MTRQAAEAAAKASSRVPVSGAREDVKSVGIVLVTGDRGLAGAFNSQIIRAAIRAAAEDEGEGAKDPGFSVRLRPPRRLLADLPRRGRRRLHRLHRPPRPSPTRARSPRT